MKLKFIRTDGGTQPRAAINDEVVQEYADCIKNGALLPPMIVFNDGAEHWLADGFHRYHAYRRCGIEEVDVSERKGTLRAAILFALGANAEHGLRRSNEDKRRAVRMVLADAEWSKWSDREIARICAVSQPFVGTVRESMKPVLTENVISENPAERTYRTKHGTEATMDTGAIGKASKPAEPAAEAPKAEANPEKPAKPGKADTAEKPAKPDAAAKPAKPEKAGQAEKKKDDVERPSDDDKLIESQTAEIRRLQELVAAAEAQDAKKEVLKWKRVADQAMAAQADAMNRAKLATDREATTMQRLRRCGKAVGQDDPSKIPAAVEAFVRQHRVAA